MSHSRAGTGRWLAQQALQRWSQDNLSIDSVLDPLCRDADPRERAFALELTLGVLRWRSRLDDLLQRMLRRPLQKLHPAVLEILRLGLYQLRAMTRIPARAVIHETVELCREVEVPWATGLVNGILRRYSREHEALEAIPTGTSIEALAVRWAHPPWLVRQIQPLAGGELEAWLAADNAVPPLTLRANPIHTTREALMARLREGGHEVRATRYAPDGVVLESGGNVSSLPGFAEGWFAVQDEASQLVGVIVGVLPGERVLDACAAPGGKTAHLAAAAGADGRILATDRAEARLKQVLETVERLAPGRVDIFPRDWTSASIGPELERALARPVDRALVDAPCSGFGVVRRIPEIKWRRSLEEASRYPARQRAILEAVAETVRPGGTLVYSVCTPLTAEGPQVIGEFLAGNSSWSRVDLHQVVAPELYPVLTADGDLRTLPHRDGCDAFYAARLERS